MTSDQIFASIENFIADYKNNYTVYKLTDPAGLVYIGYCIGSPEHRWSSGKGYKNNRRFAAAIRKCGWRNIAREIVAEGLSLSEAKQLERDLILQYDSINSEKGYNAQLPSDEKASNHYSVYLIICTRNNKMYAGYTGQKPSTRWKKGSAYSFNAALTADIKLYGWDMFITDVVAENVDEETARNFEYFLIRFYDLQNPSKGYNLDSGGFFGAKDRTLTPEQIQHQRELAKASYNANDEYRRARAREATLGTHRTDAEKKNLSQKLGKKVLCIETGEIYSSTREAQRQTGIPHNSISRACSGTRCTAGKLHWEYLNDAKNILDMENMYAESGKNQKP